MALCIGTWLTMKSAPHEHQWAPHVDDLEERRLGQGRPCSTVEAVRVRQLQKVTLYRRKKRASSQKSTRENESIDVGDDQSMGSEGCCASRRRASPIKFVKPAGGQSRSMLRFNIVVVKLDRTLRYFSARVLFIPHCVVYFSSLHL